MFSVSFQEFRLITLGILKGFLTEKPENSGKQRNPSQLKIALQGAGNRPEAP